MLKIDRAFLPKDRVNGQLVQSLPGDKNQYFIICERAMKYNKESADYILSKM